MCDARRSLPARRRPMLTPRPKARLNVVWPPDQIKDGRPPPPPPTLPRASVPIFPKADATLDMPFLFRDPGHWNKALAPEAFQPITADVPKKADVMIIGYDGGGTRNTLANKPIRNMAQLRGFTMRVMG